MAKVQKFLPGVFVISLDLPRTTPDPLTNLLFGPYGIATGRGPARQVAMAAEINVVHLESGGCVFPGGDLVEVSGDEERPNIPTFHINLP